MQPNSKMRKIKSSNLFVMLVLFVFCGCASGNVCFLWGLFFSGHVLVCVWGTCGVAFGKFSGVVLLQIITLLCCFLCSLVFRDSG